MVLSFRKLFCISIFLSGIYGAPITAIVEDIESQLQKLSLSSRNTAVIVVDLQGCFTEFKKGPLAVKGTDELYVKKVGKTTKFLHDLGFQVYATQDWHPKNHISFARNNYIHQSNGNGAVGLWPVHCVENTEEAKVLLDSSVITQIIKKGTHPLYDAYSGFKDTAGHTTGLSRVLKNKKIKNLVVYGLAVEYCVKATVIDALNEGYRVYIVKELSRGMTDALSQEAFSAMEKQGAHLVEN